MNVQAQTVRDLLDQAKESQARAVLNQLISAAQQPRVEAMPHFCLAIMRERAASIGGEVEIRAAPGAGTQIIVRLPRQLNLDETAAVRGLRVLLVDDHPLYLEGLRNLLSARGMQIVGMARDGLQAQQLARALYPDLILMDVGTDNDPAQLAALDLTPPRAQPITTLAEELPILTHRQQAVLKLVVQGLTNKEIAKELSITERTVKYHIGLILERFQLRNRYELSHYAQEQERNAR